MKTNIGYFDRTARLVIAAIIAVLYYMQIITGTLGIVLLIVGAVLVLTSFVGLCPLYSAFGINTCKKKSTSHGTT